MNADAPSVRFRLVRPDELEAALAIENAGFPPDEAASAATLRMRLAEAQPFFVGAYDASTDEMIGFVNGTCSAGRELHHESMYSHDPRGELFCMHSVAIRPDYRRKGIASRLLAHALERIRAREDEAFAQVKAIQLLAKAPLAAFYERAGFAHRGPSHVQHGADQWHLFEIVL